MKQNTNLLKVVITPNVGKSTKGEFLIDKRTLNHLEKVKNDGDIRKFEMDVINRELTGYQQNAWAKSFIANI